MHTPRLIVAALGALAWLAPVTEAADDLQTRVGELQQELRPPIDGALSQLLTFQRERVDSDIQMQPPSIQARANAMSASSPAQASPSISLATDGKIIHQGETI